MKVMLIQPPMMHLQINIAPNIGLAYIAAVLSKDDVDVRIVDDIYRKLERENAIL